MSKVTIIGSLFLGKGLNGRDYSFDEKEFLEYRNGLDRMNAFCIKNDILFYTAVVPEKFNIYSEYLKVQDKATIKRDKYFRIYDDTVRNKRNTVFFMKNYTKQNQEIKYIIKQILIGMKMVLSFLRKS